MTGDDLRKNARYLASQVRVLGAGAFKEMEQDGASTWLDVCSIRFIAGS